MTGPNSSSVWVFLLGDRRSITVIVTFLVAIKYLTNKPPTRDGFLPLDLVNLSQGLCCVDIRTRLSESNRSYVNKGRIVIMGAS